MSINLSQNFYPGVELAETMNGSWVLIGTLPNPPVHIIFDNQADVEVAISIDGGTTTWRTFPAGEAVLLDLRANHGIAPNGTFPEGMSFYGNGASGVFSISYTYAN